MTLLESSGGVGHQDYLKKNPGGYRHIDVRKVDRYLIEEESACRGHDSVEGLGKERSSYIGTSLEEAGGQVDVSVWEVKVWNQGDRAIPDCGMNTQITERDRT